MHEIIILGGGLSGISCCYELQTNGVDCLLLEKEKSLGGLTRTKIIKDFVFDSHGGHVFNSRSERVKEWAFSFLPRSKWQFSTRISKIWYKGRMIPYPFELALGELDPNEAVDCIMGLLVKRGKQPNTFGKWLKWNFGEAIADKYLLPYNRKIWKRDLDRMSAHWVQGKMPIPDIKDILLSALKKDASEQKMVHSSYYYPKQGGIWGFVGLVADQLVNVKTSTPIKSLEKDSGYFIVNGKYRAKKVISTIPIPELAKAKLNLPQQVKKCINKLDSNPITTILCEQSKGKKFSWTYLPDNDYSAHRVVYQGGLARNNCPDKKYSATYEITGKHKPESVLDSFRENKLPNELRAGKYLDFSYTKYAYPVYHVGFKKDISVINDWLKNFGIISSGRFAEWRYLNMDQCILHSLMVADKILKRRSK